MKPLYSAGERRSLGNISAKQPSNEQQQARNISHALNEVCQLLIYSVPLGIWSTKQPLNEQHQARNISQAPNEVGQLLINFVPLENYPTKKPSNEPQKTRNITQTPRKVCLVLISSLCCHIKLLYVNSLKMTRIKRTHSDKSLLNTSFMRAKVFAHYNILSTIEINDVVHNSTWHAFSSSVTNRVVLTIMLLLKM